MGYFEIYLNFQIYGYFLGNFLLSITDVTALWSAHILCRVSTSAFLEPCRGDMCKQEILAEEIEWEGNVLPFPKFSPLPSLRCEWNDLWPLLHAFGKDGAKSRSCGQIILTRITEQEDSNVGRNNLIGTWLKVVPSPADPQVRCHWLRPFCSLGLSFLIWKKERQV